MCFSAKSDYELIMKNFSTTNMANQQFFGIDRMVQKFTAIVGTCVVLGAIPFGGNQTAVAQKCNRYLGRAVEGQKVVVNVCSFRRNQDIEGTEFTYYLGSQEISTSADCTKRVWYTYNNGRSVTNRPKSQATRKMLDLACDYYRTSRPY
jgi:hypothetical protein